MRKSKVIIRQKLADLLDYMDTLDRQTWDKLGLYALYNTGLETFGNLGSSASSYYSQDSTDD